MQQEWLLVEERERRCHRTTPPWKGSEDANADPHNIPKSNVAMLGDGFEEHLVTKEHRLATVKRIRLETDVSHEVEMREHFVREGEPSLDLVRHVRGCQQDPMEYFRKKWEFENSRPSLKRTEGGRKPEHHHERRKQEILMETKSTTLISEIADRVMADGRPCR
ncbi:hypothetical protein C8R45DRAFT_935661 [Mycena sanguinolenta]|nr:hypothetical protein C8R45DRAFT_935661 [Mycena sanguinolenta]